MNTFVSPYILDYILLDKFFRWLPFIKRKKNIARLGKMYLPHVQPSTYLSVMWHQFFSFPSCSITTLISSDITYVKSLALQVSTHQSITRVRTSQINGNPYETPLQKNFHFRWTSKKQSLLIKIETIHCFRYCFIILF